MSLQTLQVKLTPRVGTKPYNVQLNRATLEILSLIFEFKIATIGQIARFLTQKDQSKYLYLKLHRMWQAQLLESFKVSFGSYIGMPTYYMLSKEGLAILMDKGIYDKAQIRSYPRIKTLFSPTIFHHEIQVVELASMEAKNKSKNLQINFKGETNSRSLDLRSNNAIEVLTPDYTVLYATGDREQRIYTEFERTLKSKAAMLKKIERYIHYFKTGETKDITLRFIFQNQSMEHAFWLNILSNKPALLEKIRIVTTNLLLLDNAKQFLEPIYASERTVRLMKHDRLTVEITHRIKLFSWL